MDVDWLKVCRECLRAAAEEIMRVYHSEERGVEISIGRGGDKTLIADKASEDTVIQKLREEHADARLISEERGELLIGKRPRYTILLDPLDGSFNFKQGLDYFSISMAVLDPEKCFTAACITNVSQGTEYYADKEGAYRDGMKIEPSKKSRPDRLLLEFTKNGDAEDLRAISGVLLKMRHVRAPGSMALDLCGLAEGKFDCGIFVGTSRYLDVAAGIFILERAGGTVTDFQGNPSIHEGIKLKAKNIIAGGNRDIQESILASIS